MRQLLAWTCLVALVACTSNKREPLVPQLDEFPRRMTYTHDYKLFQVKSGVILALVPEAKTNLVSVDVRYRVGAAEDPMGKEGLAHFVEHLMFQVKSANSEATLGERLNEVALVTNAYTNYDETHYTNTALQEHLGTLLAVEAERMAAGCELIEDERIERERQIVKREILERGGVGKKLRDEIAAAVFPKGHPYARSISGTAVSIDSITRDDICQFIDAHYGPNRAILVVSGKFDVNAINIFVSNEFGQIAKRASGARTPLKPLSLTGTQSKHQASITEGAMVIAFASPPWGTAPALDQGLFVDLLQNQLGKVVVGKLGVSSIGLGRIGGWRGGARLLVLSLEDDADVGQIAITVSKTAKKVTEDLSSFEMQMIKGYFSTNVISRHESYGSRANNVADYLQYTKHNRFLLKDLEYIATMTPQRLEIEAASLNTDHAHIAIIKPSGESKQKSAEVGEVGKEFDLETWRIDVDATQASIPVAMKATRPSRRVSRHRLKNGLNIILAPDFSYPTVDIRLVFPVGSGSDPEEGPGTARATALFLSEDYDQLKARKPWHAREIVQMGGVISTSVDEDTTTFSVRGVSMYADGLLWQLYFHLHSGKINGERLEKLKKEAAEDDPSDAEASDNRVRVAMYGTNHPYARSGGTIDISKLSASGLERFRNGNYRSSGATLIVAGRFEETKMLDRIQRLFSPWTAKPPDAPKKKVPAARPQGPAVFVGDEPERLQPSIRISFTLDQDATSYGRRSVLRELISQRVSAIRERLGASYGLDVSLSGASGPVVLTVSGEVEAARAAEALVEIRLAIADVRAGGEPVAADFVRARRRVLEQLLADSASAGSTANELEYIAARGESADYFIRLAREVASLTQQELSTSLATQLDEKRQVIVLRGPATVTKAMIKAAGLKAAKPLD